MRIYLLIIYKNFFINWCIYWLYCLYCLIFFYLDDLGMKGIDLYFYVLLILNRKVDIWIKCFIIIKGNVIILWNFLLYILIEF